MNESTLVSREEMSDLDWLVRVTGGIIEPWCEFIARSGIDSWDCTRVFDLERDWFTREQYLARRAELQNKPSWDGARKWANWLGQDEDGAWWYFSAKPKCQSRSFDEMDSGICADFAGAGEVLGDWRDTLEKRPETSEMPSHSNQPKPSTDFEECAEVKQLEPFVSVEDAAKSKKYDQVNSPSHYASGGIECIEAIKASMSHEAFLGYLKGNVQKYMWRYEKKVNPAEDLKKAQWYLSKLIEGQKQ